MALRIDDDVLAYVRRMRPVVDAIGKHDPDLARQLRRALASMVLNTAEGARQRSRKGANRFDDAMGSTDESSACNQTGDALAYLKGGSGERLQREDLRGEVDADAKERRLHEVAVLGHPVSVWLSRVPGSQTSCR